jgi:hypothetical protein
VRVDPSWDRPSDPSCNRPSYQTMELLPRDQPILCRSTHLGTDQATHLVTDQATKLWSCCRETDPSCAGRPILGPIKRLTCGAASDRPVEQPSDQPTNLWSCRRRSNPRSTHLGTNQATHLVTNQATNLLPSDLPIMCRLND